MCRLVGINRLHYYRAKQERKRKEALSGEVLKLVLKVRQKMPRIGTRKLYHILLERLKEMRIGRDKLFRILRTNGLLIKKRKNYHVTTNSYHHFRKHKDLINTKVFNHPEQVWVSDITYVGTRANPMYLALVTDAYSKKIMGYDISNSLSASGVIRALKLAIKNRKYPRKSLIHHSDRGLQYCCNAYQKLLKDNGIKCSMTESYDPYANAIAERVNGIIKQEFIEDFKYRPITQMKKVVAQSIAIYNQLRPHWSCKMWTPDKTHSQQELVIRTYKQRQE